MIIYHLFSMLLFLFVFSMFVFLFTCRFVSNLFPFPLLSRTPKGPYLVCTMQLKTNWKNAALVPRNCTKNKLRWWQIRKEEPSCQT